MYKRQEREREIDRRQCHLQTVVLQARKSRSRDRKTSRKTEATAATAERERCSSPIRRDLATRDVAGRRRTQPEPEVEPAGARASTVPYTRCTRALAWGGPRRRLSSISCTTISDTNTDRPIDDDDDVSDEQDPSAGNSRAAVTRRIAARTAAATSGPVASRGATSCRCSPAATAAGPAGSALAAAEFGRS